MEGVMSGVSRGGKQDSVGNGAVSCFLVVRNLLTPILQARAVGRLPRGRSSSPRSPGKPHVPVDFSVVSSTLSLPALYQASRCLTSKLGKPQPPIRSLSADGYWGRPPGTTLGTRQVHKFQVVNYVRRKPGRFGKKAYHREQASIVSWQIDNKMLSAPGSCLFLIPLLCSDVNKDAGDLVLDGRI